MALFTFKMYNQPTTPRHNAPGSAKVHNLLHGTRAVISILLDLTRLIDRGAALIA